MTTKTPINKKAEKYFMIWIIFSQIFTVDCYDLLNLIVYIPKFSECLINFFLDKKVE